MQPLTDYSQSCQPRVFKSFLSTGTPRLVVDIGAHDGITGSNSRELVLQGWEALLVEPLPAAFSSLQENCRGLRNAKCVNVACSNRSGKARLFVGWDGISGQTSTMCLDEPLAKHRESGSIEVEAVTATELLERHGWSRRIGILMVDTEGFDLEVLESLDITRFRPDLILTEEYDDGAGKNRRKYELLFHYGYRFCGLAGADSIWQAEEVGAEQPLPADAREFWGSSLPPEITSLPEGGRGRCCFDWPAIEKSGCVLPVHGEAMMIGWACASLGQPIPPHVFLRLTNQQTGAVEYLQGARAPRLDVVNYFADESLLFSGFRVHMPLTARAPGRYSAQLIQANDQCRFESANGCFDVPAAKPDGSLAQQFLTGRGLLIGPPDPAFADLPHASVQLLESIPLAPGNVAPGYTRIAAASHDFVAYPHLPPDTASAVPDLLRIIAPGGVLYLCTSLHPLPGGWERSQWLDFLTGLTGKAGHGWEVLAMTLAGVSAQAVLSKSAPLLSRLSPRPEASSPRCL